MHHGRILWELTIGNMHMTFHGQTLIMTWLTMLIVGIFCFLGVRRLTSGKPGKMQNVLEWVVDFVRGIVSDNMDFEKGRSLFRYLLTLIVFVFFANMLGLIPNLTFKLFEHFKIETAQLDKIFEGPALMSPTADINTTLALALLTITIVLAFGIKHKGLHYFKHFFEPYPFFLPIHLLDLIAKPMTLAFRLFGNIYAGEVLIGVILQLSMFWILPAVIPDTIWLGFCIFVGAIQAFVFTVLTTAYVGQAISESH